MLVALLIICSEFLYPPSPATQKSKTPDSEFIDVRKTIVNNIKALSKKIDVKGKFTSMLSIHQ